MYIKDSSFYGYVRDTTSASILFLRPCFIPLSFKTTTATITLSTDVVKTSTGYTVRSGVFERDNPLITAIDEGGTTLESFSGTIDFDETELPSFVSGVRKLAIVTVYGTDEDGLLLAPPGVGKVAIEPLTVNDLGGFNTTFAIPGGKSDISVESINVCEYLEVNATDLENIALKEKNDIILSSIPYNNLELSLFDQDESYAAFVKRSQRKFRSLLYFHYNDIYSQTFLHFYDEDPSIDRNTDPAKTTVKLTGLLGVLSKEIYHNTSDGDVDPTVSGFQKLIGTTTTNPSYLEMIISSFNTNGMVHDEVYGSFASSYGGSFAKIRSYNNTSDVISVSTGDGVASSSIAMQNHFTRTAADGYSHADALRLLINAQCHGMRVKNETIIGDKPENLYTESGAVFSEREYYTVPKDTKYGNIDVVKFTPGCSSLDEVKDLPSIMIDLANDGTFGKSIDGDFIRWKNFVFDESIAVSDFKYTVAAPSDYAGYFQIVHNGSVVSVMWQWISGYEGTALITMSGRPFKGDGNDVFSATFGTGTETLEISNPFVRPRKSGANVDIPDHYAKFNLEQQANKTIYAIETRGRFDVHPLDRVLYHTENGDLRSGIVIEHNLTFNGAMRSTYRILDEEDAPFLYCGENVLCSETTICRYGTNLAGRVLLYSGVAKYLESINIGSTSIAGFDYMVLILCDEYGNYKGEIEFSSIEVFGGDSNVLTETTVVDGKTYYLELTESWTQAGNNLEGYWTVTKGEEVSPFYISAIYGGNNE